MSRSLRIERLTLTTDTEAVTHEFGPGVNIIVGPVGAGKSSLLECIKYSLGGDALLSKAVEENVQTVEVAIRVEDKAVSLRRAIGAPVVHATFADIDFELSVGQRQNRERVSLYLLDQLQIPRVRIPTSRTRSTASSKPITFFDIYRYLYVSQGEIDSEIVGHTQTTLEPTRRAVFELLFGLMDARSAQLEVEVGRAREARDEVRRDAGAVRRFLDESGLSDPVTLQQEQRMLAEQIEAAKGRLDALREELRAVSPEEQRRRAEVAQLASGLRELSQELTNRRSAIAERDRLAAQLELEMQRLERGGRAAALLDEITYTKCPRCLQALERRVGEAHCYVCGQVEPGHAPQVFDPETRIARQAEVGRLQAVLAETLELRQADVHAAAHLENEVRASSLVVTQLEAEIEQRTRAYVSPRFEEISAASSALATAHERQRMIDAQLQRIEQFAELERLVQERENALQKLDSDLNEARQRHSLRRELVLNDLSEAFASEVQFFEPPWFESATLDPRTYLPVVNRSRFETLSAGEKTVTNVGYHLALLAYALRHDETMFPTLLLLDGPQSNFGNLPEDRALGDRIYRRLQTLVDAYHSRFQIIVADNDVPSRAGPFTSQIELSYGKPLVPGVEHPGPTVQTLHPRGT